MALVGQMSVAEHHGKLDVPVPEQQPSGIPLLILVNGSSRPQSTVPAETI